jgi:hypothetical protein
MSPPARNYFWGARYFDFWLPEHFLYRRYLFLPQAPAALARGLVLALAGSCASVALGLGFGRWLGRVKR